MTHPEIYEMQVRAIARAARTARERSRAAPQRLAAAQAASATPAGP